jgi:hypothetical protein
MPPLYLSPVSFTPLLFPTQTPHRFWLLFLKDSHKLLRPFPLAALFPIQTRKGAGPKWIPKAEKPSVSILLLALGFDFSRGLNVPYDFGPPSDGTDLTIQQLTPF